jgi:hypothetical protein
MSNPVIYDTYIQDTNSENFIENIKAAEAQFEKAEGVLVSTAFKKIRGKLKGDIQP